QYVVQQSTHPSVMYGLVDNVTVATHTEGVGREEALAQLSRLHAHRLRVQERRTVIIVTTGNGAIIPDGVFLIVVAADGLSDAGQFSWPRDPINAYWRVGVGLDIQEAVNRRVPDAKCR